MGLEVGLQAFPVPAVVAQLSPCVDIDLGGSDRHEVDSTRASENPASGKGKLFAF
jgi:hypothetical protein